MMTMDEKIADARAALIEQVDLHAVRFIDSYVLLVHTKGCTNKHRIDDGAGHTESEYCGTNQWYCKDAPPTDDR